MMMSIADYARHAGVTRTTVYKWLKAEPSPHAKTVKSALKRPTTGGAETSIMATSEEPTPAKH
ncbi:TPA: transcriptional regulator [Escherichia coli]|uniref:transcriptional regulator n=1 Tax=Escherichia coli TaxID=562 RepID=UPI000224347F|nr:transcriptional regulator [Escherichia coli]EES3797793.1 transcriptional regulator [Escherichia coli]EFG2174429.1 transcriptional regulator [Escherichia coli]EFJ5716094.1 transcriptional regulator [Escherichia coli]EFK1932809.1 transcriptional regulator [Escherichia coli]EFL5788999.1 transcriptional regulator [Escherichia coli]